MPKTPTALYLFSTKIETSKIVEGVSVPSTEDYRLYPV